MLTLSRMFDLTLNSLNPNFCAHICSELSLREIFKKTVITLAENHVKHKKMKFYLNIKYLPFILIIINIVKES